MLLDCGQSDNAVYVGVGAEKVEAVVVAVLDADAELVSLVLCHIH